MDNMSLIQKMPPMLSGSELERALTILPEYDPAIVNANEAMRLIALTDLYKVFVPNQMSREIYSKLYLALLRSLQKKESKIRVKQTLENHRAILQQEYSGILGGSDSFSIIGESGIGKSSAVSNAVKLVTKTPVIEMENPYSKILPCVLVQCPFDSSVKGLLLEIIRVVDEQLGSSYYPKATSARATTDMLIGTVSQICLNHVGILVVDEIQNVAISKNGRNLLGALLQLINCSGISICMVGTPECTEFFTQAMQLARRSLGLQYEAMEYGVEFEQLCQILFQYQYVKNPAELDDATIRWLYEHSNGNVSSIKTLLHDAQEIAIWEGSEVLNLETLNAAYRSRMKMLHSYIAPSKKPQTSRRKKTAAIPCYEQEIEEVVEISVVELVKQAKSEGREIVSFLRPYITIEEVRI
ncbi:MAG: TniB family NTP-binding protein [Bacteroidaceae bacterium]|nr:TniB family NTP-binding protein [Bacteroidaceae bacterium]